jgi:hypothetical protein
MTTTTVENVQKTSRAIRIHHRKRLWKKRKKYYGGERGPYAWDAKNPKKRVVINTPKLCSTCCSKNYERRYYGRVTRKEQLFELSAQEQLEEYSNLTNTVLRKIEVNCPKCNVTLDIYPSNTITCPCCGHRFTDTRTHERSTT